MSDLHREIRDGLWNVAILLFCLFVWVLAIRLLWEAAGWLINRLGG